MESQLKTRRSREAGCMGKDVSSRREDAMNQSQMQEHGAELLCICFDWWLACWISFGTIWSSCDSPGSFLMGQIALGWRNTSVKESFYHGNNCTVVFSAAEAAAVWVVLATPCFIFEWGYLQVLDSAAGTGWGSSVFCFCVKTYWVVITLSFPLFLAFIKIGVMKWLPQYIL